MTSERNGHFYLLSRGKEAFFFFSFETRNVNCVEWAYGFYNVSYDDLVAIFFSVIVCNFNFD